MFRVWHVNHFPLSPSILAWTRKWLTCQHVNISQPKNFIKYLVYGWAPRMFQSREWQVLRLT
jgi:hypothetical protein